MNKKNTINESMLDLFKSEVITQSDKITKTLQVMHNSNDLLNDYELIINHIRAIKGAANLVHIDIILPLIKSLESTLSSMQSGTYPLQQSDTTTLNQTIELFIELSQLSAAELTTPEQNIINHIKTCIDNLDQLSSNLTLSATDTDSLKAKHDITDKQIAQPLFFTTAESIDVDMFGLFCTELHNSLELINYNLLEIESATNHIDGQLEALMRAAHSIKGAARMIGIDGVVKLAHAMEDVFVVAQQHTIVLHKKIIDQILNCVDLLKQIESIAPQAIAQWTQDSTDYLNQFITNLDLIQNNNDFELVTLDSTQTTDDQPAEHKSANTDNMVRVSTQRINKLVSLAGELTVSSNWIRQYAESMLVLKRKHNDMLSQIDRLRSIIDDGRHSELENKLITHIQHNAQVYRDDITSNLISIDNFERRSSSINSQINFEIIASRMRPFSDSTQGYKRLIRDIANSLNKKVKLEIKGEDTPVDREILEKLDAPLNHIIRNAIDHGIETPEVRRQKGKDETGTITVSASHQSGRLSIQVKDDGRGVDIENLRHKILEKELVSSSMADNLSKSELLDFLFLPSFSTRNEITEISGRGVGLDIVHSALQDVRGKLHADTELDQGMQISMELPLTLSVIRSLLVSINDELYAFPLAKIQSLVTIDRQDISIFEDKQYITINDKHIGLIHCAQILEISQCTTENQQIPIIIIGDWNISYGLVVDKIIGERGLALRTINKKLGKIKDISAAAITDDGEPVLVFDIDDLQQSIQDIINGRDLYKVGTDNKLDNKSYKRVLVVDDSLTVREIEKKLLESRGYLVDIAIDGVDGWNAIRSGNYDLIISDIDMPRMNGFELIRLIKNDSTFRNIPVMMVSYKDRPEDKQMGLEIGADYYLTKGSFHDDTLLDAVFDLIGSPL